MKKHLDVVAALIVDSGKILLCQRKADDAYPLVWEFPGGCVEKGESHEQAIEREIDEEVGLKVNAGNEVGCFEDEDATLHISVYLLVCSIVSGHPYAKDCKDWGFFEPTRAEALNLGPVDRKIFKQLKSLFFSVKG